MLPVGYFPCTQDPPHGENVARMIDEVMEQAQVCEDVGFDGVFFTEHHQQDDAYLPSPVLLAGMVGMRTKRIKVGTCVLLAPLYHPVRLAEDIAVIDQATKGRFITAAGIAYQPADFDQFGVNIKQRVGRTEEVVEVLRKAASGERFSHVSKYHKIENVRVTPRTYQPGGPPIWLAGWVPEGIARAGRLADGWIADPIQSLPVIKQFTDQYREAARAAGRKPFVCLMRDCVVGKDWEHVISKNAMTMQTHRWYHSFGAYYPDQYMEGVKSSDELTFERVAEDRLIAGSPKQCLEQLRKWQDVIQPDYLMLRMRQLGQPDQPEALEDIRRFGYEVIPYL